MGKLKDLTGQKFNRLTVIQQSQKRNSAGQVYWICQCDCGNICEVCGVSLRNGHTKSCGCYNSEVNSAKGKNRLIDRTNQRYGKLTVISRAENKGIRSVWNCRCDCGNIIQVTGDALQSGKTRSCGCLRTSWGEQAIQNVLEENHIPFVKEKTFPDCKLPSGRAPRFDFYVNNSYLIEFDGRQHFEQKAGWNEPLEDIQARDQYKNQWCKEHNIPLIRIPYIERDTITLNMLQPATSKYIM